MKPSKYVIGTGMHPHAGAQEQFGRWLWAIRRHASPLPERIYVLGVGGEQPSRKNMLDAEAYGLDVRVIATEGNAGHIGDILNGTKPYYMGGWSAGVITLAMLSYNDLLDFCYAESDTLNFGPWVEWLYSDLGDDGQMTFGAQMHAAPFMHCSQSLVLIKHAYIHDFVGRSIGQGDERDVNQLPESKWHRMRMSDGRIRASHWLTDRMRPIPWDQGAISAQKFTPEELEEAKRRNLL